MNIGIIASQYYNVVDNPPSAPGNITVSNITDTSADIDWADSIDDNGIAGYNFYLDGVKNNVSLILVSEYDLTGLTAGTEYEFTIEAVDSIGQTAMSVATQFTTTGTPPVSPEVKELVEFSSSVFPAETTKYYHYEPEGVQQQADDSVPCFIMLHGIGEFRDQIAGDEATKDAGIWAHGPAKHIHASDDLDAIKISLGIHYCPQQPTQTASGTGQGSADGWSNAYIQEIIDIALANPKVNPNKIILMGLSMGGKGVMTFVSAGTNASQIYKVIVTCPNVAHADEAVFETLPLRIIHGASDSTTGGFGQGTSNTFVNDVKTLYPSAPILYTRPAGVGHDSWTKTFNGVGWALAELDDDINGNGVDEIGNSTGNNPYEWAIA